MRELTRNHPRMASGKTGTDNAFVTGTAGSNNEIAKWDANGDLVTAGVSILDEDDMASDSDTAIPTQQSVKAYVDDYVGEYSLKYSGATGTLNVNMTFRDLDLSSIVGANRALVVMEVSNGSGQSALMFKQKDSSIEPFLSSSSSGWGASGAVVSNANRGGNIVVVTDSSGIIEYRGSQSASGVNYKILCYQKLA